MALGLSHYGGAWESLSLFPHSRMKWPLYEPVLVGLCFGAISCVRYFRDDRGLTLAERGVDRIKATPRQKTGLRFVALVGLLNVMYLGLYTLPNQFFNIKADPYPEDLLKRSYLVTKLCGPGTPYACARLQEPPLSKP
jgi:hypothetical protein